MMPHVVRYDPPHCSILAIGHDPAPEAVRDLLMSRAVRFDIFTARVLCRVSYRVID